MPILSRALARHSRDLRRQRSVWDSNPAVDANISITLRLDDDSRGTPLARPKETSKWKRQRIALKERGAARWIWLGDVSHEFARRAFAANDLGFAQLRVEAARPGHHVGNGRKSSILESCKSLRRKQLSWLGVRDALWKTGCSTRPERRLADRAPPIRPCPLHDRSRRITGESYNGRTALAPDAYSRCSPR